MKMSNCFPTAVQHCNCIMGKGRCGGRGGGSVQFYIYIFIYFSFCRDLALNHVNFHFPAMFFFLQLYSILSNAPDDD